MEGLCLLHLFLSTDSFQFWHDCVTVLSKQHNRHSFSHCSFFLHFADLHRTHSPACQPQQGPPHLFNPCKYGVFISVYVQAKKYIFLFVCVCVC